MLDKDQNPSATFKLSSIKMDVKWWIAVVFSVYVLQVGPLIGALNVGKCI